MTHCWKGFTDEDGNEYTCILEAGHDGYHVPTPDNEIQVEFAS